MQFDIEVQPAGVNYKSKDNLLEDALQQSVTLEHSCKTGDCGVCSAELIQGKIENENGEVISGGRFLACQSRAMSNAVIEARYYPELANIKLQTLPCKVSGVEFPLSDIVILKLRFPPTSTFEYLPGQYVDLIYKGIKRSYSIANARMQTKEIELHIRRVEKGEMSAYLFAPNLQLNQLMRIEGPKGTFFVRNGDSPIIMLATGTGIAPIKAAVEQLVEVNDPRSIHIYWGMRYSHEFYDTGLEQLAKEHENVNFIPVVSRDNTSELSRVGYVQDAVIQDFETLSLFDVYACGSLKMIEQAKNAFEQKGLLASNFFSDAFTPAK